MQFEFLPNEILIECFEYLNATDIFYSFDQLNYRFYKIIRTLPLYFNFQYIHKSIFHHLCMKIQSDPDIKRQIISLNLSNKDTVNQIRVFLSFCPLNDFSYLQSLTLIGVRMHNIEILKSILPFISQLRRFHLIEPQGIKIEELVSTLPTSQLQRLSIPSLSPALISSYQMVPMTHITVLTCSLNKLYRLLECAPTLKYLNINCVEKKDSLRTNNQVHYCDTIARHLQKLVIENCKCCFEDFEIFIKQTPNLKSLTIFAEYNLDMINAYRWQYLITSLLHHLKIFKFKFAVFECTTGDDVRSEFIRFQGYFWQRQRHWYNEYVITENIALIYTIPYPSNTYTAVSNPFSCWNKRMNTFNTFENVTDLSLPGTSILIVDRCYFSNVISLKFAPLYETSSLTEDEKYLAEQKLTQSLKKMINLFYLKHLEVASNTSMKISFILLEILKKAPYLSSFIIRSETLLSLFTNDELCQYLNKMIKKLEINRYSYYLWNIPDKIEQFCLIFSNIEQLQCNIEKLEDVLFILRYLTKLTILKVFLLKPNNSEHSLSSLKTELEKIGITILIDYDDKEKKVICLWIERNII